MGRSRSRNDHHNRRGGDRGSSFYSSRREEESRKGDERQQHRSSRRQRSRSRSRSHHGGGGVGGGSSRYPNRRIDRHECRRLAVEFLIGTDATVQRQDSENNKMIDAFVRKKPMDYDYYQFTIEILRGLLNQRRYTIIADRWIMGIMDEDLQRSLRIEELSILRVAAYELLTHPEIPTTVVINETNSMAKQLCPQQQSLCHAAVNRMIETLTTIGSEIAAAAPPLPRPDPAAIRDAATAGLDPQAKLALVLLEHQKKLSGRRKHQRRSRTRSRSKDRRGSDDMKGTARNRPSSPVKNAVDRTVKPPVPETQPKLTASQLDAPAPATAVTEEANSDLASFLARSVTAPPNRVSYKINIAQPTAPAPEPAKSGRKQQVVSAFHTTGTQTVKDPSMESGVRIYYVRAAASALVVDRS